MLGYWLTGGASISATSFRRLRQTMSWLGTSHLKDVVQAAGFEVAEVIALERKHFHAGVCRHGNEREGCGGGGEFAAVHTVLIGKVLPTSDDEAV